MNPQQRLARLARLVPAGGSTAARTPFVLLVVVLLGSGLLTLLLLNASLNQGSFQLSRLEEETRELNEEQQALEQEIASYSDPSALEKRARELGMVPGGPPAFLAPDGEVRGRAEPAAAPAEPPPGKPAEPGKPDGSGGTAGRERSGEPTGPEEPQDAGERLEPGGAAHTGEASPAPQRSPASGASGRSAPPEQAGQAAPEGRSVPPGQSGPTAREDR